MKKFLFALMVAVSAASVVVVDAEAKRLGGGSSIGRQAPMQRQAPAQAPQNQAATPSQAQAGAAAPAAPVAPKPASPWKGILGGALLGLGLGALLSHLGIGGALASIISTVLMVALLALAAMFIYRMLRRKTSDQSSHPRAAYAGGYSSDTGYTPEIGSKLEPQARPAAFQDDSASATGGPVAATASAMTLPADFDVPSFLRHGKTYFIRLQAAWDKADVNDIREFTTPEMFGELKQQLLERGPSPNHTDVASLDAELLGVEKVGDEYLASVKFGGLIKEEQNAKLEPFAEIWNLMKPVSGQSGWVLAGIQQLS